MPPSKHQIPPIVGAFGAVMREARLQAGLTQAKLADAADISLRYVTLLEKGEYQASVAVLHRVATGLGVPLSELFRRVEVVLEREPS